MGKSAYSLNNFCISANNEQDKGCLSCHPGWGKKTESANGLVCHGGKELNWEVSFEDLNYPLGEPEDENARIYLFKDHRGIQPYDKLHKALLTPLLSGPKGYWSTLDWQVALSNGTKSLELPFSGEFDFVKTTYVYPTTHMVAPKDNVVACNECHIRDDGRMANLAGFYMPGRDSAGLLDTLGWLLVLGSLVGVYNRGMETVHPHHPENDRSGSILCIWYF